MFTRNIELSASLQIIKQPKKGVTMSSVVKLRFIGVTVLLFNLWLIGQYNLSGLPVLLLTFGFAAGYEHLVILPLKKSEKK